MISPASTLPEPSIRPTHAERRGPGALQKVAPHFLPRRNLSRSVLECGSPLPLSRLVPLLTLLFVSLLGTAIAQDETPLTRLYDTVTPSASPLSEDDLAKRTGWQLVPEDNVTQKLTGDTVLVNDKLVVVLRRQGRGAEVYAKSANGWKQRATLGHAAPGAAALDPAEALKIIENSSGAVMVEAAYKGAAPAALRFRLTTGETILEVRSEEGAKSVEVLAPTRYVVVPDFFGDDMVFGAESFRGLCLPAENLCLNLLDGGDAILMSVWQSSQQEVWLARGPAPATNVCASAIQCAKGKSLWLAFLESPGLWRAGDGVDKTEPPFPAHWRCSWVRENGVADSWDRERGPSSEQAAGRHSGPLVVYPLDRTRATPLTATCPTDVMRNTLGVGPCQYILAVEGMSAQGDPTPNSVMGWVEKQFEQKKDRKAADDIKERLEQMTKHVAEARARMERYAAFAGQVRKLLAGKPGSEPYVPMVDALDRVAKPGLAPSAAPERASQLAAEVSALIGKEDALAACQRSGEQLRVIGAVQDSTLTKCRMCVRRLRQEGRTIAVNQPAAAGLAQEVQRLADQMLLKK
jgi:hypothetical protein